MDHHPGRRREISPSEEHTADASLLNSSYTHRRTDTYTSPTTHFPRKSVATKNEPSSAFTPSTWNSRESRRTTEKPLPDPPSYSKYMNVEVKSTYPDHDLNVTRQSLWSRAETKIESVLQRCYNYICELPPIRWYTAQFPGWQAVAFASIICAVLTFLVNLILTVTVKATRNVDFLESGVLYEGDCNSAAFQSQVAHAFVNIMSSLLLAGSNYYMQLLTAPTRKDVDEAHRRREWCDVGIPSFRNSWRRVIKPWRTILWFGLALSSTPLHLFWNATFYYTPFSYVYSIVFVTRDFLTPNANIPPYIFISNIADPYGGGTFRASSYYNRNLTQIHHDINNPDLWERLSPENCINSYDRVFTFDRTDVFVVIDPPNDPAIYDACPYGNGHFYSSTDSNTYEIKCDVDYPYDPNGGDLDVFAATSLAECADFCSDNDSCIGAVYGPIDDASDGNCWLRSELKVATRSNWSRNTVVRNPTVPERSTIQSVLFAQEDGYGTWPGRWACPLDAAQYNCSAILDDHPHNWNLTNALPAGTMAQAPRGVECYSKLQKEACRLQYSYYMGLAVTVCNFFKAALYITTFYLLRKYTSSGNSGKENALLVTTGDAIASFLEREDQTTKEMCLAEKEDFDNGLFAVRWVEALPMAWRSNPHRSWFRAIGLRRWIIASLSGLVLPIAAAFWMISQRDIYSILGLSGTSTLWSTGFGRINPALIIGNWNSGDGTNLNEFQSNVFYANLPQIYLSISYYLANNYFTCMLAAKEYSLFAQGRRSLRVSETTSGKGQKSTPFLTVPLRYSAFMIATSIIIGWLASQAVFLAQIDTGYENGTRNIPWSRAKVGYSPVGMIVFSIVAVIFTLLFFGQGLRRLPIGMPIAASCSASISAACHPSDIEDVDHSVEKVQWGVELDREERHPLAVSNDTTGKYYLHCTFTSRKVEKPNENEKYA